jgi:hypothetical protein
MDQLTDEKPLRSKGLLRINDLRIGWGTWSFSRIGLQLKFAFKINILIEKMGVPI